MRKNRTFILKIDPWDEGMSFGLVLGRKRAESKVKKVNVSRFLDFYGKDDTLDRTLKPVGYYVSYSYTLFRTGEGPHDPLYRFF